MRNNSYFNADLNSRPDIFSVIGRYVFLKRRGRNLRVFVRFTPTRIRRLPSTKTSKFGIATPAASAAMRSGLLS